MKGEHHGAGPQQQQQQIPTPQVKVMLLALTKPSPAATAAAGRGSLLTLPTVSETLYAGQALRCLARVINAPKGCKVLAKLEQNKGHVSTEVGSVIGEGVLDLLMQGRLLSHGPHEIVLTCSQPTGTEILRKVYKMDVKQSFVMDGAPKVTFIDEKILARFVVRNATASVIARMTKVEFVGEPYVHVEPTEYPSDSSSDYVFMGPEEVQSFVFVMELKQNYPVPPTNLGRLKINWNSGLGEHCELFFPALRLDQVPLVKSQRQLSLEDPSKTYWKVGEAVPVHLSPSSITDDGHEEEENMSFEETGVLIHGPKSTSVGGRTFLIPTRQGLISDVSRVFQLQEKVPVFVVNSRGTSGPSSLDSLIQSPSLNKSNIPSTNYIHADLEKVILDEVGLEEDDDNIGGPGVATTKSNHDVAFLTQASPIAHLRSNIMEVELVDHIDDNNNDEVQEDDEEVNNVTTRFSKERSLSEEMAKELGSELMKESTEGQELDVSAELEKELGGGDV